MDTIRRLMLQLQSLGQGLTPSQRWIVMVAPLLVLGGLGALIYSSRQESTEFLLGGKVFSSDELGRLQSAFQTEGLSDFEIKGAQVAVPRGEVDRYTAIAASHNSLPAEFSADFDRMQAKINLFTSSEQRKELLEEGRKMRLSKILRSIPEIEEAIVEWDRLKPSGMFRPKSTLAAQVSVRAKGGQPLNSELVRSLKQFVAGALAGSTADDITVVDINTGKAHGPQSTADAEYDRVLALTRQYSLDVQNRIEQALQYIPNVLVTANVELDKTAYKIQREHTIDPKPFTLESNSQTRSSTSSDRPARAEPGAVSNTPRALNTRPGTERSDQVEESSENTRQAASFKNIETQTAGLTPTSVQVAISIPDEYFKAVAVERGVQAGTTDDEKKQFQAALAPIRDEVLQDVKLQVARLIPETASPNAINVSSYTSVRKPAPTVSVPLTTQVTDLTTQWGGVVGLVVFAGWALWMVSRSAPPLPPLPELTPLQMEGPGGTTDPGGVTAEELVAEQIAKQVPTRKEEVQVLVRDNPEMTAAILSRWIVPDK